MSSNLLKKKYGIVILLDALGASDYSDEQIRKFLSARREINETVKTLSRPEVTKQLGEVGRFHTPEIFTFGDTVVITVSLNSKKNRYQHLYIISVLMRRYLFHSLQEGIMFRGSFSIGSYIADSESNTVMGEAVSDAAAWYEQSNWMGLSSTPQASNVLEAHIRESLGEGGLQKMRADSFGYIIPYDVPMKGGGSIRSYAINWASALFDKNLLELAGQEDAESYFLQLLSKFKIPKGTEEKYRNTKIFFDHVLAIKALQ